MSIYCQHCGGKITEQTSVEYNGWILEEDKCLVNGTVKLTKQQTQVLSVILSARGKVVANSNIISAMYFERIDNEPGNAAALVKTVIHKIREKVRRLGMKIEVVYNCGYFVR